MDLGERRWGHVDWISQDGLSSSAQLNKARQLRTRSERTEINLFQLHPLYILNFRH
jgi:hypothetical protein